MASIELKNFSVTIDSKVLAYCEELTLPDSGLVFILGVNGSGKTSLLRGLLGMAPVQGHYHFKGKDFAQYSKSDLARQIAWVPSVASLSFDLPVHELLMLGRYPVHRGYPSSDDRNYLAQMSERCGIDSLLDRMVHSLSSGEAQKVQIIRGLMSGADIMVLDEPCAHLDPKTRFAMMQLLKDQCRLVLIASHDYLMYQHWATGTVLVAAAAVKPYQHQVLAPSEIYRFYGICPSAAVK